MRNTLWSCPMLMGLLNAQALAAELVLAEPLTTTISASTDPQLGRFCAGYALDGQSLADPNVCEADTTSGEATPLASTGPAFVADSRDPKDEWRKATCAQNAKDEADLVKRLHDKIDLINRTLAEIKDLQSRITSRYDFSRRNSCP